jgi:arginyl-tRNA synthetase
VIPEDIAGVLGVSASGTWRPAPPKAGGAPGTYSTSLPFLIATATAPDAGQLPGAACARTGELARRTAAEARELAGVTAAEAERLAGVTAAEAERLAGVTAAEAGKLAGVTAAEARADLRAAEARADLTAAELAAGATGREAGAGSARPAGEWGREPREVAARLAATLRQVAWISSATVTGGGYVTVTVTPEMLAGLAVRVPAAGAACAASDALCGVEVTAPAFAGLAVAASWGEARQEVAAEITGRLAAVAGAAVTVKVTTDSERTPHADLPPPARAAAFAGSGAIRYALARTAAGHGAAIDVVACARNDLRNPFFMVCFAHAQAASVLRWAADLGVGPGPADAFRPDLLGHASERELLGALSWMPERAASAARRRRPDAFARYLEGLAGSWLDCWECCPALPFGGRSAPRDEAESAARLWLAAAAQTGLGTGMRLLGVTAPERL